MIVDARGLQCPLPLLKAKKALSALASGERVEVLATDAGSWRDFTVFAEQSGHLLVEKTQENGEYRYVMEKR